MQVCSCHCCYSAMHSAGRQFVVPFGDKLVDFNQHFKLFLSTHNPTPNFPPDTTAIVNEVSFAITRAEFTLEGQNFGSSTDFYPSWFLVTMYSLYSDCNVSPARLPVITHLLVRHCPHGTFDLYRHLYCWSAVQIRSLSCAFSSALPFFPSSVSPCPSHPNMATPGALPFSHVIPMPLLPQGTHTLVLLECSSN